MVALNSTHRNASLADALNRTTLLMRDHLTEAASDETVLDSLRRTRVVLECNAETLNSRDAQIAFMTAALLMIRSGAQVSLAAPDVKLIGSHAPFDGASVTSALLDSNGQIMPDLDFETTVEGVYDLAVVFGPTESHCTAIHAIRLSATAWEGSINACRDTVLWTPSRAPFGALAAAGLAAIEAYKAAMRRLREHARKPDIFDELFAPVDTAAIRLAPSGTPNPCADLGEFDCISGGAIIQSALYVLARLDDVSGRCRVIEPEIADVTNLNRYMYLTLSGLGRNKAEDLRSWLHGKFSVESVPVRYDSSTAPAAGSLSNHILIGVDDIPSRWFVQANAPESWIGVGATSHYMAMASTHFPGVPCVWCAHPTDDPGPELVPTASWVSFWAGLWIAALFLQRKMGLIGSSSEQVICASLLKSSAPRAVWKNAAPFRKQCPNGCSVRHSL